MLPERLSRRIKSFGLATAARAGLAAMGHFEQRVPAKRPSRRLPAARGRLQNYRSAHLNESAGTPPHLHPVIILGHTSKCLPAQPRVRETPANSSIPDPLLF